MGEQAIMEEQAIMGDGVQYDEQIRKAFEWIDLIWSICVSTI
jgi:hypothetical protein